MNSFTADDLSRENLALETAKCLQEIHSKAHKVILLEKEIEEINLSISAYVEESRKNLEQLCLNQANEASSSQQVVQILSNKQTMSSPLSSGKRNIRMTKTLQEDNNNKSKLSELQQARSFITWYKHMFDNERQNLCLYLSDDSVLEWFGRTIKNRKKVTSFLKYEMQYTHHNITSVENIENIQLRNDRLPRNPNDSTLASPLQSPDMIRPGKRKLYQSGRSPEWAEGCKPVDETETSNKKKKGGIQKEIPSETFNGRKRLFSNDDIEVDNKGDGMVFRSKRKCIQDSTVTPPHKEVGQGDCLPSTSDADSNRSHDALNAQLPKLAVECNGFIEFSRSRNNRSSDGMKWERKFKMQISYSIDPLNIGEYIIWMLRYTDETKCRRNLLAAFEEAAKEDSKQT